MKIKDIRPADMRNHMKPGYTAGDAIRMHSLLLAEGQGDVEPHEVHLMYWALCLDQLPPPPSLAPRAPQHTPAPGPAPAPGQPHQEMLPL